MMIGRLKIEPRNLVAALGAGLPLGLFFSISTGVVSSLIWAIIPPALTLLIYWSFFPPVYTAPLSPIALTRTIFVSSVTWFVCGFLIVILFGNLIPLPIKPLVALAVGLVGGLDALIGLIILWVLNRTHPLEST